MKPGYFPDELFEYFPEEYFPIFGGAEPPPEWREKMYINSPINTSLSFSSNASTQMNIESNVNLIIKIDSYLGEG